MPFALVTIGLLLIVVGAKGTYKEFGAEVADDFTGPDNFTWWIASLGAVGMLGYIEQFRMFSRAFMSLIIIAMLLSNRGFFAKLQEALSTGPIAPAPGETADAGDGDGITPTFNLGSVVRDSSINQGITLANMQREQSERIQSAGNTAVNIAKMFI